MAAASSMAVHPPSAELGVTLWMASPAMTVRPKNQWSSTPSSSEISCAFVRRRHSSPKTTDSQIY
ncbi:hypothetical protein BDV11DRAFT_187378 [Aspergillus similis]